MSFYDKKCGYMAFSDGKILKNLIEKYGFLKKLLKIAPFFTQNKIKFLS